MIFSNSSFIPNPVFAETAIVSVVSIPINSLICFLTFSTSDEGKSTLFKTGIISRFASIASHALAKV